MDSSRDSSLWRSLAVTFGGGLALGAVGMKLSQSINRPLETPAENRGADVPEPEHVRVESMEERLAGMERRMVRFERPPGPQKAIDQKVIEAVVNAVDARLAEQRTSLEKRLTQMEAALRAEDQASNAKIRDAQNNFLEQMITIRAAVVDELNHFGEEVEKMVSDQVSAQMDAQTEAAVEKQVAAIERAVESRVEARIEERVVTAVAAATAARFDQELAPLRAEVAEKERELIGLRQRLADSERSVLDVVLMIGQVCRQAAERLGVTENAPPVAPEVRSAPVAPELRHAPVAEIRSVPVAEKPAPLPAAEVQPVPSAPAAEATPPPAAPLAVPIPISAAAIEETPAAVKAPGIELKPVAETPAPGFTQPSKPNRLWRVPLVSSLIMAAGLLVRHYL